MKTLSENDSEYICEIKAPCFQALNPEEADLIRSSRTQVLFRKGDNLIKQGTFASYVLFVVKGLAIQYVEGDNNKSFNLRIIQPGEFVGLSSVFSANTFSYSSVAICDCQVMLVEKTAISKVINQNGSFGLSLIRRYTEQNNNLFETLRVVLYKQMMGRIAETLLYIDEIKKEYVEVFTLLSRKNLADFAGITTESAVKMLKMLDKEGVIKLEGKDVELLNKPYLLELSKKG
ncbi:Crp/Fnr family transcriptional regulator [Plebeiibacterium marinum]|uniref:Crp/Fnr family transcriptional regulator n=1 Tax=Plebeiibacterium marinum TaxID=2992111 RepID=A0AAE3MEZ3_9BACT|nr:Crp/Fnr family transcriptional regulator [Plebeiobacterium marinum]MCW3806584.1 Crp/Fnr family transcriptional regulator [Plebeiobacterium marinum]